MRKSLPLLGVFLLTAAVPALSRPAQEPAPSEKPLAKPAGKPEAAETLLQSAMKKAKDQKKAVFVLFDASW